MDPLDRLSLYILLFGGWCLQLTLSILNEREKENGSVGATIAGNIVMFCLIAPTVLTIT